MNKHHISYLRIAIIVLVAMAFGVSCNKVSNAIGIDISAPVITTRGHMIVKQGETPDYRRWVTCSDDQPGVTLTVDSSRVNINVPGTYDVIYTATDADGNTTSATETIEVQSPDEKIIYLTFDDGPSECTPEILDILSRYGIQATFFVTAQFQEHLHYLSDIVKQGSVVAAHSYSHDFNIYASEKDYFDDLNKINDVIQKFTGQRTHIIRFPGGSSNSAYQHHNADLDFMKKLCKAVVDSGYQYVDWNISSNDATGNNRPVSYILRYACGDKHNQYCLLMHDTGAKKTTVEALPSIIEYYKFKGFKFGVINSRDIVFHHNLPDEVKKVFDYATGQKIVDGVPVAKAAKSASTHAIASNSKSIDKSDASKTKEKKQRNTHKATKRARKKEMKQKYLARKAKERDCQSSTS